MSSEVQHSYQLRSRIPRPRSAFMLFAEEKRRSVADENPNENNQRVSSRLRKLWRSLSGGVKEPYQRKVAEAAIVHRRNHPDYVYNPREAHRHKAQERRARRLLASPRMAVPGTRSSSRAFPQPWPKIEVSRSSSIHHHHRRKGTNPVEPALPVAALRVLLRECRSLGRRPLSQPRRRLARLCGPTTCTGSPVSSTLLNDEDDKSSAGTSLFDQSGFLENLGSAGGAPDEGQPS
ncbi:hypothetical protein HPB49_023617 [Dermacentor silvarum]|uniref:Uncharacterized protein n=1 Tax=Dermacentor silvarum TaxID=543639 RepID=A0ACB8CI20_DERSI|nr:hypothetical protein HPB49_023617 [Dermacentor silvarum]